MLELPRIYLAGSFHGFRDRIIAALPEYAAQGKLLDPRKHRQTASAKVVNDDLSDAAAAEICLVVAPKGKSRGVLTYVELGVSYVNGRTILNVDENDQQDGFLKTFAQKTYCSLEAALSELSAGFMPVERQPLINQDNQTTQQSTSKEQGVLSFYLHGSLNAMLHGIAQAVNAQDQSGAAMKKRFYSPTGNHKQDLDQLLRCDCLLVHFPRGKEIDRQACFFMGAAYAGDVSPILIEENPIPYPTLQPVARRQFREVAHACDWVKMVDSMEINREANVMYQLFKKYNLE